MGKERRVVRLQAIALANGEDAILRRPKDEVADEQAAAARRFGAAVIRQRAPASAVGTVVGPDCPQPGSRRKNEAAVSDAKKVNDMRTLAFPKHLTGHGIKTQQPVAVGRGHVKFPLGKHARREIVRPGIVSPGPEAATWVAQRPE